MSIQYDVGIIDAQYILRRNFKAMRGRVIYTLLEKSFLQSIMKLKKDIGFSRPVLCFDKGPYIKSETIKEYKKDRHYISSTDVEEIEKRINNSEELGLSEEEVEQLKKELESIKEQADNEAEFIKAKYDLINNLPSMGFPVIIKQGFEADDIAFALSEKVRELGKTAVLLTVDRDWVGFRSREVYYLTPNDRRDTRDDICRYYIDISRRLNVPLYDVGILKEIYDSSHNNVEGYEFSGQVDFDTFITKLASKDTTLPGYDKAELFYKAMDIRPYLKDLDSDVNRALGFIYPNSKSWSDFCESRGINIPIYSYYNYSRKLYGSLLGNGNESTSEEVN